MMPDERKRLSMWLAASAEHRTAFDDARALLSAASNLTSDVQVEKPSRTQEHRRFSSGLRLSRGWRRLGTPTWGGAAAAGLVFACLASGIVVVSPPGEPPRPVFETAIAQIEEKTLDDGTVVTMGPKSVLRVDYRPTKREVTLVGGEAFFSVVSDPGRPFIVNTDDARVTVLGTAFNVRRGPRGTRISVSEGRVEVEGLERIGVPLPLPARITASRQLSVGQEISSNGGQLEPVQALQADQAGAWRSGWLAFAEAPLGEIIAVANRYSPRRLVVRDPDLNEMKVTAGFWSYDLETLFSTLELNLPITVDQSEPDVIVLTSRPK